MAPEKPSSAETPLQTPDIPKMAEQVRDAGKELGVIEQAVRGSTSLDATDPKLVSRLKGMAQQLDSTISRMEGVWRSQQKMEGRIRSSAETDDQILHDIEALRQRMDEVQAVLTLSGPAEWSAFVDRSNVAMQRKSWFQLDPERSSPALAPLESAYGEGKKLYDDNYVETRPETKPDATLVTRFAGMLRGLSTIEDANKAYAAVRGETPPFVRNARKEAERYMGSTAARNEIISYIDTLWKRWDDVKVAMKAQPSSPAITEISSMLERANAIYGDAHAGMGKNVEDTTKAMMAVGLIETALDKFDAMPSVARPTAPVQTPKAEPAPTPVVEQPIAQPQVAPSQPTPTVRARGMTPSAPVEKEAQPRVTTPSVQPATVEAPPVRKTTPKPAPAVDPVPEKTPDAPASQKVPAAPPPIPETTPDAPPPAAPETPAPAPAPAAPPPPEEPKSQAPVAAPEITPSATLRLEGRTVVLASPSATLTYRLDDGRTMDAGIALSAGSTKVTMPGSFTAERSFEGWRITPDAGVRGVFTLNTGNETLSIRTGDGATSMESAPQQASTAAPREQAVGPQRTTYATRGNGRPVGPIRRFIQRMRNRR